eukprot:442051-Rhodomonas_salina.1
MVSASAPATRCPVLRPGQQAAPDLAEDCKRTLAAINSGLRLTSVGALSAYAPDMLAAYARPLCAYAPDMLAACMPSLCDAAYGATRCVVLSWRMALPYMQYWCYQICGTNLPAYG